MEIRVRDHYFYAVESFYMDYGWHWLTPLREFRGKFVEDPNASYKFESQVQLENLLADMKDIIAQHGWLDCDDNEIFEYVFFIPDSFCPKFGVIWSASRYGTVIVSPFPLPNVAKSITHEYLPPGRSYPDIEVVPDESRMLGPIKLPLKD